MIGLRINYSTLLRTFLEQFVGEYSILLFFFKSAKAKAGNFRGFIIFWLIL